MKKWLIALTFCLAICVCACFAMADPAPNAVWEVTGVTEDLTTHDSIRISVTVNGANRVELYTCDANGNLIYGIHEKKGSTCTASWATDTGGEYWFKAIAYFGEEEYGFIYSDQPICVNSSEDLLPVPTVTISDTFAVAGGYAIDQGRDITFRFTENPALFDQNGDRLPEHEDIWYTAYLYRMNGENQPVQLIGEPMGNINAGTEYSFGTYELIGGETYCISVDIQQRGYDGVAVNAPFLVNPNQEFGLRGENEPRITVDPVTGVISAPMHQWIVFRVTAPNAGCVRPYCLDAPLGENEGLPEGAEPFDEIWTNGSPISDFQWVTNTLPKDDQGVHVVGDYSKYFYVQIDYDDGISRLIGGLRLDVDVNETSMRPVAFTVDGTMTEGRYEVARDGRLFVNVNNYYQDENDNRVYTAADYYGIYIGPDKDDDSTWMADSHWVKVAEEPEDPEKYGTTRVPLTVPRCDPGEYTAHVFAIKFGEPQLDLGDIPITVTEYNGCPFILSMGNKFVSGDPLRVYAHYTDPDKLNGWMTVRIVNTEDPYDVIFEDTQGYKDFWNDTSACWHEGTFRVEADIWCWSLEKGNHIHKRYPNEDYPKPWIITVTATDDDKDKIEVHEPLIGKTNEEDPTGDLVWLPLTTTSVKAGEDLNLKILKPDYADFYEVQVWYYHPEWGFENFLFEGYELTEDETIINISKNDIPDANPMNSTKIYIGVHGLGRNKNDKGEIWGYPVMPKTATGEVILTVDGLGENNTVLVNKDISLAVTDASDEPDETRQIQMVGVFSNNGFTGYHGPDGDGIYRDAISFEDEGQYPVFALVTFDEVPEDFEWWRDGDQVTWYATNTVEVTATSIGQVGEFSFTLDDSIDVQNGCATVERGKLINVTYTPADHATNYWIDIDRYEEEWDFWGWIDHVADLHADDPADPNAVLTAVIPTARLEAGKYRIRAVANGEGYLRRETEDLELNITEPESSEVIFNVDVPADENGDRSIVTCEDYLLTVYAPGAEWVDVIFDCEHYNFDRDEGWRNDWREQDSVSERRSYSNSGTYTLVARGWYPGYDENTGEAIYYPIESAPIVVTVTANGGIVEVTRPDNLPVYIELGTEDDPTDDLVFTVAKPKNAAFYRTEVWYDNPYTELYKDNDVEEENTEVIIPADSLPKDERRIRVKVRGWGYNLEADEKTWDIPMVPAASDKVTLTMTGLGEENTLPVNTDATLRVEKAVDEDREIQTVYIYDGYGNWDHDEPDGDGAYERRISFGDEGTFAVYAMVTFDEWDGDGDDNREWVCTNVVTVNVTKTGDLGPFSYTTDKTDVTRGELITVTYTPEDETGFDVHYWVDIGRYNEYGEWYYLSNEAHVNSTNGGTATILTAWMEAGTYYLRARSNAPGYVGREPENDIAITVTEPENNGFIFTVDVPLDANRHGTVHTSEDIRMSAYAPGASFIEVLFDYDHFNFEDHEGWRDDWDGDFFRTSHQYGNSGEYKLAARAWCPAYDEVTGNPIWEKDEQGNILTDDDENYIQEYHWVESDPIVLNVIATGGSVTVAKPEGLPAYIMAGTNEDLTFTVEQPENAEYYEINVWCDGPDGVQYADNDIEDLSRTVTIPSGELPHEENLIRVRVRGWGYNVESAEETWNIPVVPAASDKVTLTMTGLGDENTLPVNTDATLRVEKMQEEDREIRTICVYDGRGEWNHEGPDNDGAYERDISFDDVGTYAVYAKVTFDTLPENFDWENDEDTRRWFYTNTEVVTVEKNGDIGAFTFSVDCDINEQYGYAEAERGQIVTVTYEPAEHATHYWIDVERYDEGQREWRWIAHAADLFVDDPEDANTVWTATMMTAEFDSEHSYRIRAAADAEGYVRSYTNNLDLEIAEPSTNDIIVVVDVPEEDGVRSLLTGEEYLLSVYAPGANWIEMFYDYDNYDFRRDEGWKNYYGRDSFSSGNQYDNSGEYKLVARACYSGYDEDNDEWFNYYAESEPIILTVTANGENVVVARPEDLPTYIQLRTPNPLAFTVTKPENADQYRIEVWYDNPYTKLYEDNDLNGSSRPVTIPADRLPQEEKQLRVKVRGWGYNKEADEKTWNIPVVPEASEIVTLTMTGLGEGNKLPVNTDATLRVETASGVEDEIKTIYVYGGYGYWDHEGPDEDGAYEHGISFGEARTFTVYAMVTFDPWDGEGEDTRTWYATNVVTVNVTKTGDLGPFSYELNKNNVTRGELITVTYTPETETDFDVHYWVDIGRYYGNSDWRCEWNEAHVNSTNGGTAAIPTARLEAGTYYIRVKSNAPGYVGWEPEEDVVITVTEPEDNGIIFNVDVPLDADGNRTVHTSEDIQMSAYARGASYIEVIFDYDHFDFTHNEGWRNEWDGDSFSAGHQYGNSGVYKMTARAWYSGYDENNDPVSYSVESESVELTVTSNGNSVEIARPADLPTYITAGTDEDLAFTVDKPENAEYYEINVWYDDPDGGLYGDNSIEDPSRTVTIAAADLPREENRIHIKVRGWGRNVEAAEETWEIPVVPEASEIVTLTMTGLGEGNTLPVNTDATLRVEKTQNEERNIQTVCVFGGYDHWGHEGPDEDGAFERNISFGEERTFVVYAMVTFDEWDGNGEDNREWVCTNVVTVNTTKEGDLSPFSYTLDKTNVTRGDLITVTYTPEETTNFDVHYWLDIGTYDDYGNWRGQGGWDEAHLESMDGGTAVFRTEWMGEGTYYIRARSSAPGYVGFEPENETAVTITEPEAGSILFAVDVPETDGVRSLTTCEEFQLSVYAPGAERVDVIYDRDSYDFERDEGWKQDWGGDRASGNSRYDKTGTYTLIARGWYPVYNDSGEPISETDEYGNSFLVYNTVESAPIELTVTATGGSVTVTKPTDLPNFITAGAEDLEFTVTKPQNAEGYSIDVWCDGQNYNLYSDGGITDESRTVTVDRYMLPWADTWVNVRVCGYGYNLEGDDQTWRIPVIRADNHVATLTLEGLGEGNTIPVNKDAKLTITKNPDEWGEIQTVCVFGGYGFRDHDGVDGDGVYRSNISFGDEETFVVYALVTFDPWNDEWNDLDYDPRSWYATNAVTVNVTARGQANPFTIGLSSAQVNRGEKIRVTINTPEGEGVDPDYNPDHYGFNLRDMDDPDWRWITPNSIAEINTTNLRPGTYQICAYGNAEGLTRYETPWETITVNNPEMGNERIRFRVNGGTADVTAQIAENLEVSVIAPGAIRVGFFEDGNPWHEENGRYCWADSCDSWYISDLYWMFGNDVGTHELKAAALFDEDEGWVQSDPIHVTITKTGDLAFDLENVPPYFTENAAESFTIDLPDHADWMRIRAYRARETGDNGQPWRAALLFDEPELFDDYTVSIPGSSLNAGEQMQIWIEMEAFGLGYASDHEEKHIPVLPEPAAGGATLAFENATPDENGVVNVLLNQELEIALVPDDGETLAAVRFFDGKGFWEDYQGEEINQWNHSDWFRTGEGEDGAFHVRFNYDWREDVGLHTVFAYYRLEGEDNMSMAGPIVVNVSALGTVGAYDFVPNQETTVTVTRGEMVTFEFTAAQNAEYYWLDAFSGEGDDWHSWDPDRTSNGTKVTLFTAELPAGEYEIWGRAGRDGWIWTESDSYVKLIVTEQDADWVNVNIRDEVLTNEYVHWSVFAPDAAAIDVEGYVLNENNEPEYFFQAGNQDWRDTTYINGENVFTGHAGTAYVAVTVWYADSDPRTYTTPITVSAPNGDLSAPRYSGIPWYAGQDLNITITPDQNTEWYTIDGVLDGYGTSCYRTPEGRTETGAKTLNVSWNQIGDGYISITIHQHGVGYNDSHTTVYIRPIDTTGLITLPAALSTIEEGAFEDNGAITHVIIPDGVTFIGDRAFCNCSRLLTVEIQSRDISFGTNAFDAGITIYGYSGSTAESYAQANGIPFVSID